MNYFLIGALVIAGLGFLLVLYKLVSKIGKKALQLPTNFLLFFLVFAIVGLTGFLLRQTISDRPLLIGAVVLLVSLSSGTLITHNLYDKWEWSQNASFFRKLLYLAGLTLTGIVAFSIVFLLSEHRGLPTTTQLGSDIVWWFGAMILLNFVPLLIKQLHHLWNQIPKIVRLKPFFQLPLGDPPPFIETGGASIRFNFIIPFEYRSKDMRRKEVAVPYNVTLQEVFHYALHDHNIVKRHRRKIIFAENNQRSKVYGWSFYQPEKKWWGWWTKKRYLNPGMKVGRSLVFNDSIFCERVKTWVKKEKA